MRSGTCVSSQQTLTPEAASVLKHSLSLAARRGHSHVTPLHVASTLLSSKPSTLSLFRRACLKSHPPHPLQSRALELCFNVALNRLPTSSPPLLHSPSLSNALIAALKRAQAHQRRGTSLDHHHHHQQQQLQHPLLAIKVELQHLVISILDDPSVSRVMREAGFSSTAVKNNIEEYNNNGSIITNTQTTTPLFFFPGSASASASGNASKFVFEVFLGMRKRKNVVLVGDSNERLVLEVMNKFKMGEVPQEMKGVKFVEFVPYNNNNNTNVSEFLRRKLGEIYDSGNLGGVVLYVGDLKWIVERGSSSSNYEVDSLIGEIERLLVEGFHYNDHNNINNKIKIWVMGVATYQIYMRCQMRLPSLETQWDLHALPLPSSGLALTLHSSSVYDSSRLSFFSQSMETKPFITKEEHENLNCCEECTSNFHNELHHLKSFHSKQVPSWLQSHTKEELVELKRKWNKLCSSLHRDGAVQTQSLMGKSFSYSPSYPWWPKSNISFTDHHHHHQTSKPLHNFVPRFRRQQSCTTIEFDFGNTKTEEEQSRELSLNSLKNMVGKEVKITLALGNSLFCDSSAESMEMESERKIERGEILKVLEENVPWQSELIPCIAEAVISMKKDEKLIQWVLMEGNDFIGKRKMGLVIAELLFGSVDFLLDLNVKSEEMGISKCEMLEKALKLNRELVVFVEDVEMVDSQLMKFLENGFQSGKFEEMKEESIKKVIFILTKDDSSGKMMNRGSSSSSSSVIEMTLKIEEPKSDHKRKAEWEFENKSKNRRINSSLDLNMEAEDEEEEEEDESGNGQIISPITSDLTGETKIPNGFVESISKRFVMNKKPKQESEIREELKGKMREAYKEKCKWDSRFRVEEGVIEGILEGFGSFSKRMFEKWVKEIFQTSLENGRYGGKGEGGIDIKLCLDHKHILEEEEEEEEDGYMGSCLPKKIKLSMD
ncbi:protein SMAX1-LIKE 4-like [Benincasa hispida]|uniref:protein SMAX1-LIKE 4-like n=1 Tax=Benincasa hispida TaxID=102211 RepID=UPI001900F3E5|nr:protein SMAX1-LIKE 4-like [Benincasa hispida]